MSQRLVEDACNRKRLVNTREIATAKHLKLENELDKLREQAGAFRDKHANVFDRLSVHIDALVKLLLGEDSGGKLVLDGNGLGARVEKGSDCSTAAIDALKVLVVDLAILLLSFEGGTRLPAFLIHDSPRESDLGQSIYNRPFDVTRELEQLGKGPLFQYIVTTTSEPPEALQKEPWCNLEIHGSPSAELLLMMDP